MQFPIIRVLFLPFLSFIFPRKRLSSFHVYCNISLRTIKYILCSIIIITDNYIIIKERIIYLKSFQISMKRKINRVGVSTLTVSLPSKWVQKYSLKAGQEVELYEEGRVICISSHESIKKIKQAVINIDGFNSLMVKRLLNQLYISGVDEITITFSNSSVLDYKTGKSVEIENLLNAIIHRFIGIEIVSQTSSRIVLQNLLPIGNLENLGTIQKRSYFLIKEFLNEFINNLNTFDRFYPKVYDYHDAVERFINYYIRLLTLSDLHELEKSRKIVFHEKIKVILDKIRHTGERLSEMKKINIKIKSYVTELFKFYMSQFDFIIKAKLSVNEMDELIKQRYELVKKINAEKFDIEEAKVIAECKIILDTIIDFIDDFVQLINEKLIN